MWKMENYIGGVGFMCMNHSPFVPWRAKDPGCVAETVEEFEQSHIYFDYPKSNFFECPQHPAPEFIKAIYEIH